MFKRTMKKVSLITLTHSMENQLVRCIQSVNSQDYPGEIEHIIIGDNSPYLLENEKKVEKLGPNIKIYNITSIPDLEIHPFFLPSKIAYLRNFALNKSGGDYIGSLDDDNTFDPDHVSSLVTILDDDSAIDLAYSWRKLLKDDDSPFNDPVYIWPHGSKLLTDKRIFSEYVFNELVKCGVREQGSNIIKDCVIGNGGEELFLVDASEFLVRKQSLLEKKVQFRQKFFWRDIQGSTTDDHVFIMDCYRAGFSFKSSERPTLNYYVGGLYNG